MRRKRSRGVWIGLLAGLAWWSLAIPGNGVNTASADTIRLRNGDVVSGKLLKVAGGEAVIETDYAGQLVIDMAEVVAIETDRKMTVEYEDGREVDGVIDTSEDGVVTIQEGAAPETAEEAPAEAPEALDLADVKEIHEVTPYYRFAGHLDFGLNISKGNSDNENVNLAAAVAPSFGKNTIAIDGRWNRGKSDGELSASNWRINAQYEREFWEKWFFLLFNSYEYDKLQDLDLRTTVGAGFGYKFFEPDPTLLKVSLAPAFVQERFDDTPDGDTPDRNFAAGRWTLDFDQDLWSPDVSIYHSHILTFGITEDQLILLTAQGIRFDLIADLALKAEFQWDYNKSPADSAKSSDYRYLLKIVYDFKGDENDWWQ